MNNNFLKILTLILILGFVSWLCIFIGIDFSIRTLLLVMVIDYVIGTSLAITGKAKHENGTLSSKIGYKGIIKKVIILLLVGLGAIIDDFLISTGISFGYIREISTIAFILNESLSIVENAKLSGLKIPDVFNKIVDFLNNIKNKK